MGYLNLYTWVSFLEDHLPIKDHIKHQKQKGCCLVSPKKTNTVFFFYFAAQKQIIQAMSSIYYADILYIHAS